MREEALKDKGMTKVLLDEKKNLTKHEIEGKKKKKNII